MTLPATYVSILAEGASALRARERRLRDIALRRVNESAPLLAVRDTASLAMRLEGVSDWEWRTGFASTLLGGQDLSLVCELGAGGKRDDESQDPALLDTAAERAALVRLCEFLKQYTSGVFAFDDAAHVAREQS
jgi:hypothetical protein